TDCSRSGAACKGLACLWRQLACQPQRSIYPPQRFENATGMHRDVPRLLVRVNKIAHQPMPVAVEVEAHQLAGAIEYRAAGIAADGVGRGDEAHRCRQLQFGLILAPTLRKLERLTVPLLFRALEGTRKGRKERQPLALDFVAPNRAEREAKGKRGIRGHA